MLYSPSTAAGDTTRSDFILSQLTTAKFQYSPASGVGSASAPFKGTLLSYMQQFTSAQGAAADAAAQLADGQDVVLGVMTTKSDPEGRKTVFDYMPEIPGLTYVGRLDFLTEGLLLMTNDNRLAERVTNPESHVPKTYLVTASPALSDAQLQRLRDGLELSDGPTRPARVTRVHDSETSTRFEIVLTEGRNRQVRRMVEALDAKVQELVRIKLGPIVIGRLPIGTWRTLTPAEVAQLC